MVLESMKITSKLIAMYQLVSAAAFALGFIWFQLDNFASQIAYVLLVAVNLVAGVGLWRDLRWAQVLRRPVFCKAMQLGAIHLTHMEPIGRLGPISLSGTTYIFGLPAAEQ